MASFNRKHHRRQSRRSSFIRSDEERIKDHFRVILKLDKGLSDLFESFMKNAIYMKPDDLNKAKDDLRNYCATIKTNIDEIEEKFDQDKVAEIAFRFNYPFYKNIFEEALNGINLIEEGISMIDNMMKEKYNGAK